MVDFKKLLNMSPEERAARSEKFRIEREEYEQKLTTQSNCNKAMIRKLEPVMDLDIYSDWERSFIKSITFHVNLRIGLSEKQQDVLDRFFKKIMLYLFKKVFYNVFVGFAMRDKPLKFSCTTPHLVTAASVRGGAFYL